MAAPRYRRAMARRLKVYRTAIGFHDAYVAAPSQKAALQAWGSDADLFARGMAETVTDAALSEAPLAEPGTVIRRLRGNRDEHLAALPADRPKRSPATKSAPKRAPKPSRAALDKAERTLEAARDAHDAALADLREREKALQQERRALERDHAAETHRLETAAAKARDRYRTALEKWRA